MPTVRPATAQDATAIAAIWRAGWLDAHHGRVPAELVAVRTTASFTERAIELWATAAVAEADGDVAGFAMVADNEVEQVYVAAPHRGAGVAGPLLADAERRIREAGHVSAWLAVVGDNAQARRFYERHGWRDDGPFEHAAPGPGGPIAVPAHRYVKGL